MIERHLAHVSSEELGDSYDRMTFLDQRREMIQCWADLLDDLTARQLPSPQTQVAVRNAEVIHACQIGMGAT